MPRRKEISVETNVKEKIEYLGLKFERVPQTLIADEELNFKPLKGNDERQYKQYKFVKISDIDIYLTPKHRMDSLKERIEEARPLYMYLDSKNEENTTRYSTFLSMLKKIEIQEVENVEKEQELLAEETPFKVKYSGNYLWQIYYSEESNQYFMIVPTEDSDYSTFFYLLKKKIKSKRNEMIYVPISYLDYSGKILKTSEIKDLENYLWLFTKDYPAIYEVYDEDDKMTLQILGETPVYGKIKTLYKMVFKNSKEALKFYKLLKALFILQVEIPHYFNFETKVDDDGTIEIYLENEKIDYDNLLEFLTAQYAKSIKLKSDTEDEIEYLKEKLKTLKQESTKLEQEYIEKEKIISTFLECKKSFFGKVKYYFKLGKNTKKVDKKTSKKSNKEEIKNDEKAKNKKVKIEARSHTLDELIIAFKELEATQNDKKSVVQDINAIKLKNKNLKKKIENAASYIDEINKHKKSIFEFWKYSNKDEVAALEEGEEEEESSFKVQKVFDYESDFELFGESIDKSQRMRFTDSELDSSYLATTSILDIMNDIYMKKPIELKDITKLLKKLKEDKEKFLEAHGDEFDIFGGYSRENKKERSLGSKTHRETPRNVFDVLGIKEETKPQELKKALVDAIKDIKKGLKKNLMEEDIYLYKASQEEVSFEGLQVFSLNEENEIKKVFNKSSKLKTIYLYRIKIPKNTNYIAISNIILYNNKNMTLPVGMSESDDIIIDMNDINLQKPINKEIKVKYMEDEKNDFSETLVKTVQVLEIETKQEE